MPLNLDARYSSFNAVRGDVYIRQVTSQPTVSGGELTDSTINLASSEPTSSTEEHSFWADEEYTDADLYTALLLPCGHGYPQWIPMPDVLPSGHEEHGVSIGDVGIVDPCRSFDFLFNICEASESPINHPYGLPLGTSPVTESEITSQTPMWGKDSVICSRTTERRHISIVDANPPARIIAEFHLKSSSNVGALLVLPEGGSRQDLRTDRDFLNRALQHGQAWYQYARNIRRRMCPNGSLYLVTGQDKTCLWGLTSFSSASGISMVSVKLGIADTFDWESDGCAIFRRSDDSSLPRPVHENQCVFLRGFMISERGSFSKWLTGQDVSVQDIKKLRPEILRSANPSRISSRGDSAGRSQGFQRPEGWANLSGNQLTESGTMHMIEDHADENNNINEDDAANSHGVTVRSIPGHSKFRYPSAIINEWLLSKMPDAQVAVTHDYDWCALITEEDISPLCEEELIRRVSEKYHPVTESGGVFLVPRVTTREAGTHSAPVLFADLPSDKQIPNQAVSTEDNKSIFPVPKETEDLPPYKLEDYKPLDCTPTSPNQSPLTSQPVSSYPQRVYDMGPTPYHTSIRGPPSVNTSPVEYTPIFRDVQSHSPSGSTGSIARALYHHSVQGSPINSAPVTSVPNLPPTSHETNSRPQRGHYMGSSITLYPPSLYGSLSVNTSSVASDQPSRGTNSRPHEVHAKGLATRRRSNTQTSPQHPTRAPTVNSSGISSARRNSHSTGSRPQQNRDFNDPDSPTATSSVSRPRLPSKHLPPTPGQATGTRTRL